MARGNGMFILHSPQEAVEVLVEGVVNPMNAFVIIINGFDTNEAHHVAIAAGDLLEVTASKAASIGANEAASEVQAMVSLLLRA